MNYNPIILVAGDPNSIFLEIFFKSLKIKKFNSPIILICSQTLLTLQMKKLRFNYKINLIDKNKINFKKLNNNKINLIDVNFNFNKTFDTVF